MVREADQRKLMDALDQLAFATGNDRTIVEKLTAANAEQTATKSTLVAQLAQSTKALKKLAEADQNQETMRKERQNKYNERFDPNGHYWSHGYKVTKTNTSKTCTEKKAGHQDGATRSNLMGGNTLNKNWTHPRQL